ncbi:hypothetical protein GOV11_00850 [Candidatus Woesearchaeota archaeon]|nr:hypothetical protein [Candidatus Woesearchaeota archaeon]
MIRKGTLVCFSAIIDGYNAPLFQILGKVEKLERRSRKDDNKMFVYLQEVFGSDYAGWRGKYPNDIPFDLRRRWEITAIRRVEKSELAKLKLELEVTKHASEV